MLELGVIGDASGVASVELSTIDVEFCEPGVGGERGDVNRVESTKSSPLYSSSGGEMDTVTLVGLVVLVLERCVSDEGRPSAGDSSIMGGGTRFVSDFAFCEGV